MRASRLEGQGTAPAARANLDDALALLERELDDLAEQSATIAPGEARAVAKRVCPSLSAPTPPR